jgi:hypothetical protein
MANKFQNKYLTNKFPSCMQSGDDSLTDEMCQGGTAGQQVRLMFVLCVLGLAKTANTMH